MEAGTSPALDKAAQLIGGDNPAGALKVLSAYLPAPEELSSYHQAYARALDKADRFHDALSHYRLAFVYASERFDRERLLLERADLFMRMRNYQEAILAYKAHLGLLSDSRGGGRAHLGIAEALYRTGRYAEAHAHYRQAGNSSEALSGRAKALHHLGRLREASEIFQYLLDSDRSFLRSSQETVYTMGENLRLFGKLPEAKLYLSTIIEKPWKQWSERSLGLIAAEEGKNDAALKFLQSAARSPERKLRAEALLGMAEVGITLGKADDAKLRLVEIRNGYPFGKAYERALILLSRLYRSEGQVRSAEGVLNELVFRRDPPKEALDEMQAVLIALADKDTSELRRVWRASGKRLLEPERSEALLTIARGLRHSGKPYLDVLDWVMRYGTPEAKTKSRLAMAGYYAELGETDAASRYLNGARLGGTSAELVRTQARLSLAKGEHQKAFAALRSLKELTDDDVALLAELSVSLGRDRAFLDFFGRALDTATPRALSHLRYAEAAAAAGRKSEASDHYTAVLTLKQGAAGKGEDDRVWCLYRLAHLSPGAESLETLKKMQTGSDVFSRYSRAAVKEALVVESMEKIF